MLSWNKAGQGGARGGRGFRFGKSAVVFVDQLLLYKDQRLGDLGSRRRQTVVNRARWTWRIVALINVDEASSCLPGTSETCRVACSGREEKLAEDAKRHSAPREASDDRRHGAGPIWFG